MAKKGLENFTDKVAKDLIKKQSALTPQTQFFIMILRIVTEGDKR